jgi:large subunit ribosomal protein L23
MGIFDKFKTEEAEPVKVKKAAKKTSVKKPVLKEKKIKAEKAPVSHKKIVKKEFSDAYKILRRPMVTEKAFNMSGALNQYVFEVSNESTKNEIKKAIQDLYGVRVNRVNIINVSGKKRRVGQHEGFKPGYKKAVVFLPAEEKIEAVSR